MRIPIFVTAFLLTAGCNYNHVKNASGGANAVSAESLDNPDFKAVASAVIGPQCVSCHSNSGGNKGNLNLEDYRGIVRAQRSILYRIEETRDMPPGAPLSDTEVSLIRRWFDNGAPETVIPGIGEKPDPGLNQGPNNWEKIGQKILAPKCAACHTAGNALGGLDVSTSAEVRDKILSIIDRVFVKKDMPLIGAPALTPKEAEIFMKWVSSGMPE